MSDDSPRDREREQESSLVQERVRRWPAKLTTRQKVFATFDDPMYSLPAKVISVCMMLVILISTVAFIAEAETLETGALYEVRDAANGVFQEIELVCIVIFTLEYAVRLASSPKPHVFVIKAMNLVDLAAIIPFWVMKALDTDGGNFSFVRVIRLIRVLRVFKLGRYSVGLQMFAITMSGSLHSLGILVFVMSINTLLVSSIMHLAEVKAEQEENPDAYDPCYCTITNTFWWAVVTMSSVGYGDCYPVTAGGKSIAVITMLMGIVTLALPITVIGSNFSKVVAKFEEEHAAYTKTDGDGDRHVDERELRAFVARKKKEGVLRPKVDARVSTLMAKYDPKGHGKLSEAEFTQLQRDITIPSTVDLFEDIRTMTQRVSATSKAIVHFSAGFEERLGGVEQMLTALAGHMGVPGSTTVDRSTELELPAQDCE